MRAQTHMSLRPASVGPCRHDPRRPVDPPETTPAPAILARSATQTAGASRTTTDVALVATFAAFIAVAALLPSITVAGMAVPITLQTFAVLLAGVVLGARRGALATACTWRSVWRACPCSPRARRPRRPGGPSMGYLIASRSPRARGVRSPRSPGACVPALRPAVLFRGRDDRQPGLHPPIGIAVMGWRLGLAPGAAIRLGATFLRADVIKNLAVAVVAAAVFRAFPDMLRQRR